MTVACASRLDTAMLQSLCCNERKKESRPKITKWRVCSLHLNWRDLKAIGVDQRGMRGSPQYFDWKRMNSSTLLLATPLVRLHPPQCYVHTDSAIYSILYTCRLIRNIQWPINLNKCRRRLEKEERMSYLFIYQWFSAGIADWCVMLGGSFVLRRFVQRPIRREYIEYLLYDYTLSTAASAVSPVNAVGISLNSVGDGNIR